MRKISEAFEGENSSLRKTFDGATANYMQVLPGVHCMRCHKNYGNIEHGCTGNGTACSPECDKLLKIISDPKSWTNMENKPNPGSTEAQEKGCTCPVVDNHFGEGILIDGEKSWWMTEDCPIHGFK